MSEYIKRQDAYNAVLFAMWGTGYQYDATRAIDGVPAADVAPVVHGKWITIDDISRCSECKYVPAYDSAIDDLFYSPYCPNCGAKMDGKERQNNE